MLYNYLDTIYSVSSLWSHGDKFESAHQFCRIIPMLNIYGFYVVSLHTLFIKRKGKLFNDLLYQQVSIHNT